MKAWRSITGNKHLDKLNQEAVSGTAMTKPAKMEKSTSMENGKAAEKAKNKAYGHGLYGAFRMAIKTGKAVSESLGPIGSAVGIICTLADTILENMEKVEMNNAIVAHLSSRIKRQIPTLQSLKKNLEKSKDDRLAGQLLPHIENLGEVYIQVHEKVIEWSGSTKASMIMRMMSSQEYYEDFLHLEIIVTSCMTDLGTAISTLGLLVDLPEPVDKDKLQEQVREAIREDMQVAMRDILEAEVNGVMGADAAVIEQRASKLFKEYGLDFKELKRKERKRWRHDKLKDLVIPWKDITVLEEVGKSMSTRVLRCTWQRHTVALKEYSNQPPEVLKEAVEREGYIMSLLRHPNIIQIYGIISEDGRPDRCQPTDQHTKERHFALVLEFHEKGSLQALMDKAHEAGGEELLPVKRRVELALQIARGMSYLHGRSIEPIVHGNLKPANVLIAANGRAVISDFGAATMSNNATMTAQPNTTFAQSAGAVYTAPEIIQLLLDQKKPPPSVDVFSFGVLMFELMTLQPAYAGFAADVMDYTTKVGQGKRPAIPPELPPVLQFCIMQCWAQDPARRPNFSMVVDMLNAVAASLA